MNQQHAGFSHCAPESGVLQLLRASGEGMAPSALFNGYGWNSPMSQHCHFEASRPLAALEQDNTIIAVIEMNQPNWLVAALVPGVERQPLKRLDAQEEALLTVASLAQ